MSRPAPDAPGIHLALPPDAVAEIVHEADTGDQRLWVPRGENVWSLPLMFSVTQGSWVNVTRARGDGVISRHRHASPVTGFTLDGAWGYLEHEWTARRGTFVFEPPGETHTLVVRPEAGHMTVLFHNFGPLMNVDGEGRVTGYVDVFTRIEVCRRHYEEVGLGADYVQRLIR
jgi:quercetin dioxygenase-like cupin family protein